MNGSLRRMAVLVFAVCLVVVFASAGVAVAKPAVNSNNSSHNKSDAVTAGDTENASNNGKANGKSDTKESDSPKGLSKKSDEGTATVMARKSEEEKLTGLANALARIQANMLRAQEAYEAGERNGVPSGLGNVMNRFMLWLGLSDHEGVESTGTIEPTGTVEPTGTADPQPEAGILSWLTS